MLRFELNPHVDSLSGHELDYNAGEVSYEEPSKGCKFLRYNIKVSTSVSNKTRYLHTKLSKEVGVVMMNLLACMAKGKKLEYSRNTAYTKKSRYNKKALDNRNIIKAVDFIVKLGYATSCIASSKQNPRNPMTSSFIQPTQRFIDEFCSADEAAIFAEQAHMAANEVIILRDVNGNDIDYKDNDKTEEARALVIKLNTISYNSVFKDRHGRELSNELVRIFSLGDATFSSGGRYARSDLQNMFNKEDQRLYITIDDESVVEVDYSNLHIRMLTDLHGVDSSKYKDTDLYHMPLGDDDLTLDNRWLIKQAVNIMFNTDNERAAMSAIQGKMKEHGGPFCFKGPKEVVTSIKAAYTWLADDFCQGVPRGHYLMNLDSWIAHDVALVFADLNTPIGIIHDSFIVKEQYKDTLIRAMVASYRKHVESDYAEVHMKAKWAETSPFHNDTIIEQIVCVK